MNRMLFCTMSEGGGNLALSGGPFCPPMKMSALHIQSQHLNINPWVCHSNRAEYKSCGKEPIMTNKPYTELLMKSG
jgi:hypothetical protein